ncbi:hypothetical protein [Shewanella marisflavi]|uniref:hypothetical protein n=1 Tax=Shewanella marisflavi TaxID=260364 RepID=UPI003AAB3E67
MSNVIELLEQIGNNAELQTQESFSQAVLNSNLSDDLKKMLLERDVKNLARELDVCSDVVCAMLPAEDEPEEQDENDTQQEEK